MHAFNFISLKQLYSDVTVKNKSKPRGISLSRSLKVITEIMKKCKHREK